MMILVFCCALAALAGTVGAAGGKMLLSSVGELEFKCGERTAVRRVDSVEQCACVEGDACGWVEGARPTIRCKNGGPWTESDPENVRWSCEAEGERGVRIKVIAVSCEGYLHSKDPYKLERSCGLRLKADFEERILLSYTDELRFVCPSSKCICSGGFCDRVDAVTCRNIGNKGPVAQWFCEASPANSANLERVSIECEGFGGHTDPYKRKSSCAVRFQSTPPANSFLLSHAQWLHFNCSQTTASIRDKPLPRCTCNGHRCPPSFNSLLCSNRGRGQNGQPTWACQVSGCSERAARWCNRDATSAPVSSVNVSCEGLFGPSDDLVLYDSCSVDLNISSHDDKQFNLIVLIIASPLYAYLIYAFIKMS